MVPKNDCAQRRQEIIRSIGQFIDRWADEAVFGKKRTTRILNPAVLIFLCAD